ncbi:MAG: methionyl-tRNA formyltransferase [Planctomycetaceae bacterium]|nr:methionyl-tRNA formyltransferase [Planctomycetaceae bacterium]
MATGAFSVPSMQAIYDSGEFDIQCLVTNPLRYDKLNRPIITPARRFAEQHHIAISEKEDVHSLEFFDFLYLMRPDILFVCDFGQILSKRVLSGSLLGGINLHGSLLPKYRGAAPVHWAIMNGEQFTGISIIHMTPQIDAGPVIAQSPPIPIHPFETAEELEERLAHFGAELVLETLRKMAKNEPVRIIEQFHKLASKAPRLKKEDGLVDWSNSSRVIFDHYRAMPVWPKSYTDWTREDGTKLRLILGQMLPLDDSFRELSYENYTDPIFVRPVLIDAKMDNLAAFRASRKNKDTSQNISNISERPHTQHHNLKRPGWWKPGTVIRAHSQDLIVAAGEGTVQIFKIQPAGKKMMDVRDFLLGYPIKSGDQLE